MQNGQNHIEKRNNYLFHADGRKNSHLIKVERLHSNMKMILLHAMGIVVDGLERGRKAQCGIFSTQACKFASKANMLHLFSIQDYLIQMSSLDKSPSSSHNAS